MATAIDVDDYIGRFPSEVQAILEQVRQTIRAAAPQAQERISYQMPAYNQEGNLVYFGGFKTHIGFYPTSTGIAQFEEELAGYKWAKGSVQFPLDRPMPLELITRIVRFRVEENLARAAAKRAGR
jgi:uncharacterized protein YdhG (YjbR/CyaY superfamily)